MIETSINICDLNPYIWRNMGHLIDVIYRYKEQNTLWILIENGNISNGIINHRIVPIKKLVASDNELFTLFPEIDGIVYLDYEEYKKNYIHSQQIIHQKPSASLYFCNLIKLLEDSKAIRYVRRNNDSKGSSTIWMDFYGFIDYVLEQNVMEDIFLIIEVMYEKDIYFQICFSYVNKKIMLVTTMDHFAHMLQIDNDIIPVKDEYCNRISKELRLPVKVIRIEKEDAIHKLEQWMYEYQML